MRISWAARILAFAALGAGGATCFAGANAGQFSVSTAGSAYGTPAGPANTATATHTTTVLGDAQGGGFGGIANPTPSGANNGSGSVATNPQLGSGPETNVPTTAQPSGFGGNGLGIDTGSASVKTSTRTVSGTNQTFGNQDDPPAVRAEHLDRFGTSKFYDGVEQVAIGIATLSAAEQDKKESGETEEVAKNREDGLNRLAQGAHDVDVGHQTVDQANAIRSSEMRIASAGSAASTALQLHELAFDPAKAPESTNKALDLMEKIAGVPKEAVVEAVNHGGRDQLINLAAGANGVGMSPEQVLAAVGNYQVSDAPAVAAAGPSAPAFTGVTSQNAPLAALPPAQAASFVARMAVPERRAVASAERTRRGFGGGKEESLQPLSSEQFLGTVGAEQASALGEFGDPGDSLFRRVRGQYSKRRAELHLRHASGSAR